MFLCVFLGLEEACDQKHDNLYLLLYVQFGQVFINMYFM